MSGREQLREAIRRRAELEARQVSSVVQLANVVTTNELTLELLEARATIYNDEFDLSQWVTAYDRDTGIERGDTVVLVRKHTGGEINWLVIDVVGDKEPAAGGGSGDLITEDELTAILAAYTSNTDLTTALAGYIPRSVIDAKGDLVVGTGDDLLARLPSSGVPGQVLTVVPAAATGLDWVTPSSGAIDFIQSSPSAVWTWNHNLGFKPMIEIIDSAGSELIADVDHTDDNTVVVSFIGATAGKLRAV